MNFKILVSFFISFFSFFIVYPQSQESNIQQFTIESLINYFEKSQNITFSYDINMVKDSTLIFDVPIKSIKDISLNDFLKAFKNQTFLAIKQKDGNFIIFKTNKPILIKGKVVNKYTREVITNVMVTDGNTTVYTNETGDFTIQTKAFRNLYFYFVGYADTEIAVSALRPNATSFVMIEEQTEMLEEVIISKEYLTFGIDKSLDGAVVVNPNKLKLLPGLNEPDIMQSVQLLPGVNSTSEGVNTINIRGGTADHNLILWDGIKIYNPGNFFDKLPGFNSYIVEQAKVYRSGASAKYGGRIGGVIDINSVSKIPTKIKGSAGVSLTSVDGNIQIPLGKKLGIVLAGRRSVDDIFPNLRFDIIENNVLSSTSLKNSRDGINNQFSFHDINSKIIWNINNSNTLKISGLTSENLLSSSTSFSSGVSKRDINFQATGVSLQLDTNFSKRLSSLFTSQYSAYAYKSNSSTTRITNTGSSNFSGVKRENKVDDISIDYKIHYLFNEYNQIFNGYEYSYNNTSAINTNFDTPIYDFESKLSTHGIYSEYQYHKNALAFKLGIRANYYSELKQLFLEPRFFGNIRLMDHFTFNVSAERRSQALRQDAEDPNVFSELLIENNNIWLTAANDIVIGDGPVDVPLLTSNQLSVGLAYKNKSWDIDINYYIRENKGIISLNDTGVQPGESSLFTETGLSNGLDIFIKKRIKGYRTWMAYSYSRNELNLIKNDIRLDFLSSYDHTHILNWSHTIDYNNFEFGVSWNYRTGSLFSIPSSFVEVVGDGGIQYDNGFNTERLDDYQCFNASLVYNFNWFKSKRWKSKVGISVQNIFNTINIVRRSYTDFALQGQEEPDLIVPAFEGEFLAGDEDLYINDRLGLARSFDFLFRIEF